MGLTTNITIRWGVLILFLHFITYGGFETFKNFVSNDRRNEHTISSREILLGLELLSSGNISPALLESFGFGSNLDQNDIVYLQTFLGEELAHPLYNQSRFMNADLRFEAGVDSRVLNIFPSNNIVIPPNIANQQRLDMVINVANINLINDIDGENEVLVNGELAMYWGHGSLTSDRYENIFNVPFSDVPLSELSRYFHNPELNMFNIPEFSVQSEFTLNQPRRDNFVIQAKSYFLEFDTIRVNSYLFSPNSETRIQVEVSVIPNSQGLNWLTNTLQVWISLDRENKPYITSDFIPSNSVENVIETQIHLNARQFVAREVTAIESLAEIINEVVQENPEMDEFNNN